MIGFSSSVSMDLEKQNSTQTASSLNNLSPKWDSKFKNHMDNVLRHILRRLSDIIHIFNLVTDKQIHKESIKQIQYKELFTGREYFLES